jgi:hypothetical protein
MTRRAAQAYESENEPWMCTPDSGRFIRKDLNHFREAFLGWDLLF